MLTVAVPKRNKLQNIIVLTPKDGFSPVFSFFHIRPPDMRFHISLYHFLQGNSSMALL